jgi:hypothetical protein
MTREKLLRNQLEMAKHNLCCYSADYLNTTPKAGMEAEHKEAAAEVEMLEIWLKEFRSTRLDSTREFIGRISGWSGDRTYDGRSMAKDLRFEVDTGASYTYGDERMFDIGHEVQNWFVGEGGGCGRYDIEKVRRYGPGSRAIKITVDSINTVRSIEWIISEDAE